MMKHPSDMPTPRFELGGSDLWSNMLPVSSQRCPAYWKKAPITYSNEGKPQPRKYFHPISSVVMLTQSLLMYFLFWLAWYLYNHYLKSLSLTLNVCTSISGRMFCEATVLSLWIIIWLLLLFKSMVSNYLSGLHSQPITKLTIRPIHNPYSGLI